MNRAARAACLAVAVIGIFFSQGIAQTRAAPAPEESKKAKTDQSVKAEESTLASEKGKVAEKGKASKGKASEKGKAIERGKASDKPPWKAAQHEKKKDSEAANK
jgi:hypothetical protein